MRSWVLPVAALIVPLLWGVVSYWLLAWLWPGRRRAATSPGPEATAEPLDFQI